MNNKPVLISVLVLQEKSKVVVVQILADKEGRVSSWPPWLTSILVEDRGIALLA
jgi:hypothetical protein